MDPGKVITALYDLWAREHGIQIEAVLEKKVPPTDVQDPQMAREM